MNKDFEHMTLEERRNDPDWAKMSFLERLHAAGMIKGLDGEKITLDEFRYGMSEEREARIDEIRQRHRDELKEKRRRAMDWLKNRGLEIKDRSQEFIEELKNHKL